MVFVYLMEALKDPSGAFTPALLAAVLIVLVSCVILLQLNDSVIVIGQRDILPNPEVAEN